MWINTRAFRFAASCITLWLTITLFASVTWAQTPDALDPTPTEAPVIIDTPVPTATTVPTEPVVTVEPEEPTSQPEPEPTQAPTEPPATEAPAATEAPEPTSTQQPTEEPVKPEPEPTVETPEPTPTEIPESPDQLQLVTSADFTINPGEQRDVVIRYTLGSDRSSTKISVNLTAPGGESLAGWSVDPVGRADLYQDVNDPAHLLKAGIAFADLTGNGDSFETTWRITAPAHIELPFTIHLHANAEIHEDGSVSMGVIQNDLLIIRAVASAHQPTLTCDASGGNAWNCAFNTSHPADDVAISASADVPAGWELSLNGADLSTEPTALGADTIVASSFSLAATYPVGCPDATDSAPAELKLNMTYPSGDAIDLQAQLPVSYEKPESMLTISSFDFDDVDLRQSYETTGHLKLAYQETPCGWEATIQLTDLTSGSSTIPAESLRIQSVAGLPGASITLDDGVLKIRSLESEVPVPAGELTISLVIQLPYDVQPGSYRITTNTQFIWISES